ncbi:MAG: hypothetical protein MUE72_09005 [Chitinophagaceae bacterium]|jgi:hypothetical protein|nr:hypothetical protein [Chitinophagaceae bacterium]
MDSSSNHNFHIPVLGLGFTIDTPVKVARYGISSVLSIVDDFLVEAMREIHCVENGKKYEFITSKEDDYRARRITAYLNLLKEIVDTQFEKLKQEDFESGIEIHKYFELLPNESNLKLLYTKRMQSKDASEKLVLEKAIKAAMAPGSIDVNIMTKLDKTNYSASGEKLGNEYSDAHAALRGFALSNLDSSIVFSAGLNPKLYSYCATFQDFYPDENGHLRKKIIVKVSDYRSALVQGKFFAKKGLWVSEFRIESGLNCGGHAFATDGLLLGPILDEFKRNWADLFDELYSMTTSALKELNKNRLVENPELKITAQGGVGTGDESTFLLEYYKLNSIGWGSPFLLVPEATNVETETLTRLSTAKREDYYLSHSSPLGIPFNNFKLSTSEEQRRNRIEKNRPGSPCYKKFLSFDSEFSDRPICTASREYQNQKLNQAKEKVSDETEYALVADQIMEKDCLCEGLGASALIKNGARLSHNLSAVTICPGPNLAFFSGVFTLKQMVDHIYGRANLLNTNNRPHVFINELKIYIDYLKKEVSSNMEALSPKKIAYFNLFKENLGKGIEYYKSIAGNIFKNSESSIDTFLCQLLEAEFELKQIEV